MKKTFKFIFLIFAVILLILPFATTFNELLTRIVENTGFYRLIEQLVVPYIAKIVASVLNFLPGIDSKSFPYGVVVNGTDVRVTWNCLGWQSFLLLIVSMLVGFRGDYSVKSKIQVVALGLSGTFLINIFRIVFTAALVGWWSRLFAILFHNYFMTFVSILWLLFFWWFSYAYVLEEKVPFENKSNKE
jgi:exosortase/archaeosortase family protein